MRCYVNTCGRPTLPGSEEWGFDSATSCSECFNKLKEVLANGKMVENSFLEDYARIKILMVEQDTVRKCLRRLASELSDLRERIQEPGFENYRPQNEGEGHIKLSAALAKYEQYCWFPPSHEIFIGFVPADAFNRYIARGIMAKDPGAGLNHGDFTHRLHWHAIARVITKDFEVARRDGWNHTPLELYTSLGQGPALAANMWFNLLDDAQQKDFTSPDKLHDEVKKAEYGILHVNVARRFKVRQQNYDAHFNQSVFDEKYKTRGIDDVPDPRHPGTKATITQAAKYKALDVAELAGQAYAKRKQEKFKQVGELPIVKSKVTEDPLTIEGRIALSKTGLNKTATGSADVHALVYSRQLGMLSRGLGKRSLDLKGK